MLKKSIFKVSLVGIGNLTNALLGFIFIAAVAKTLTVADFGRYALLASLLVAIAKIMDFGTNSTFVAHSITKSENITTKFISLRIILFFITMPIAILILYIFKMLNSQITPLFLIGLVGYGVNFTLFAFFQKLEKFGLAVLINTLPASLKGIATILIFTKTFSPDLTQAFSIFSLSILTSILLYPFLPKEFKTFKFSALGTWKIFKTAFPAGTSLLIIQSWQAIQNTVVKITKTFTDVGIFSLADKIADVFALISLSIFTVLLPKNALRKKEGIGYNFKETLFFSGGILLISVVSIFFAETFVEKIFGAKYAESIRLLDILIASSALTAIYTFIENYFFVEEKTRFLFLITGTKLATFLILSSILIPIYSLQGLAFADLVAALLALMLTFMAITHSKLRVLK